MEMSNCLMQINQCGFLNCGLHFANQYDLTAHIEYTHIPVIEEDVKRKNQFVAASGSNGDQSQSVTNLPLSYYSRVFRTAYRPNPIKPEPIKVSFNHYKKRALRERQMPANQMAARILRDMMTRQGKNRHSPVTLDEAEKRLMDVDFEECGPENNEVRFRCAIVDCNKRYKSMFSLRVHMKINHNVLVSEDAKSLTNYPSEDSRQSAQTLLPPPMLQKSQALSGQSMDNSQRSGTPTNSNSNGANIPVVQNTQMPVANQNFGNPATNTTSYKCTYCSKRYKTSSGLSNHMMASHQKISDVQDAPSPQVVEQLISQVRMQRQQQEQNNSEQGPPRSMPPQTSQSQTIANILKSSANSRSFSVTTTQQPMRFSQQHYQVNLDNQPSTGQVLQMQMQHQKRMKQIQEQQAAQAAAQQQQHQHQQHMQQGMPVQHQQQFSSSPVLQLPVGQNQLQNPQPGPPHQPMGALPQQQQQQQQQYHQMPPQQHSPYPQQMHNQMAQNSPHHYQQQHQFQQHQQSPQFPPYQDQSPQQQQPSGPPPQRSPIPLSQSLPPLNSMTQQQRPSMQQMPPPNTTPMHLSPPNQQSYNMMTSPTSGQPMPSQPPSYNM